MKRVIILSVIIILLVTGCTTSENPVTKSERQEIISFTQDMLDIEARRSDLMVSLAGHSDLTAFLASQQRVVIKWLAELYFLDGVSQDRLVGWIRDERRGMLSLRTRLLLLDCPQDMQVIKDSLVYIYNSEISLAELEFQHNEEYSPLVPFFGNRFVLPEVNQYNIELWQVKYESWQMPEVSLFMNHPWVKLQLLRRDIYTRWAEILQEHDIDPLGEGFTGLIKYLN